MVSLSTALPGFQRGRHSKPPRYVSAYDLDERVSLGYEVGGVIPIPGARELGELAG